MAAGPWQFYNSAKKHLCQANINLATSTFRIGLYTSASNANLATLSVHGSVGPEVTEANGYLSSGKALSNPSWGVGASASEFRFNSDATVFTASGGDIPGVKFAVVFIEGASAGARKLVMRSQLSSSQFTITSGNTLTITPSANGYFELN